MTPVDEGEARVEKSSASDIARLLLLSLALTVASLIFLPFYGAVLVVLPLPTLFTTVKYGLRAGLVVGLAPTVALAVFVPLLAAPALLSMLVLGVCQGLLTIRAMKASRILTLCITLFIVIALLGSIVAFASGAVTVASLQALAKQFAQEIARYSGNRPESVEAGLAYEELYIYLLPAGIIVMCLGAGLANFLISQQLLRSRGLASVALSEFKDWQLPWYLAWGFLAGLAAVVAYNYVTKPLQKPALYTGLNLMVVFSTLFMVQGLAVVVSWLDRLKVNPALRAPLVLLAGILQAFAQVLSWIGLLDVWFNFRKMKREL